MTREEISELVARQRTFYATGATLDVEYRIAALKKLRQCLTENEAAIGEAIRQDLGKSATESYMCETGLVIN